MEKERAALRIQCVQRRRQASKKTEILRERKQERLRLMKAKEQALVEATRKARESALRRRQEQQRAADDLAAINGIKARRIGGGYVALPPRSAKEIEQIKERLQKSTQKYGPKRKTDMKKRSQNLKTANAIRERNKVSIEPNKVELKRPLYSKTVTQIRSPILKRQSRLDGHANVKHRSSGHALSVCRGSIKVMGCLRKRPLGSPRMSLMIRRKHVSKRGRS